MKKFCLILLCSFIPMAFASQRIPVQEGLEVNAVVSTQALNRIAVENDRITSVKGNTGQFELDKDLELGQVFLKPLIKESPIPIFITTEKGHTYHLGLTTHELSAESIILVPLGEVSTKWEQSSAYESLLKTLIQAMHTQTFLEGFIVENAKLKVPQIKTAKVSQLQSYIGQALVGQILEVSNPTSQTLELIEADFYLPGVRAITLLNKTLSPKAKTRVYLVRS